MVMKENTTQGLVKAVIYIRVSTKDQVDGASLETQEVACRSYAEHTLHAIVDKVYKEEGESAKTANRTELTQMLSDLQKRKGEVDFVVFYDMSRASRDVASYTAVVRAQLLKLGIKIRSVCEPGIDESPIGEFIETITVAQAQLDNRIKAKKVHEAMSERAKQGYWVTQPPIGFKIKVQKPPIGFKIKVQKPPIGFKIKVQKPDGSLEDSFGRAERVKYPKILVPDTTVKVGETISISEKLTKVFLRFAEGDISEAQAHRMALELGVNGIKGKPITFSRFDDILRSPVYAGYNNSKALLDGEMVKLKFDGLISKEIFDRIQTILNSGKRELQPKNNELYPLDGTILCSKCGMPFHGDASKDGSDNHPPRYYCRGGFKCGHGHESTKADYVHVWFNDFLQQVTPTDGTVRLFKEILKRTAAKKLGAANAELADIAQQENRLSDRKNMALNALLDGKISVEEKESLVANIDHEREELRKNRLKLEQQQTLSESTIEYICNFIDQPAKLWRDADLEAKRAFQKMLFPNGLHIDIKAKKCRTADLSPLYSVIANKKAPEGGNSDSMVISAGVEPALTG